MTRSRALSKSAVHLLTDMAEPWAWAHGYELSRRTGLKSGTLYPLLIRLAAAGLLEAEWRPPSEPGRPPRHAYRLTAQGLAIARAAAADRADQPVPTAGRA